jgi:hypothetical protein
MDVRLRESFAKLAAVIPDAVQHAVMHRRSGTQAQRNWVPGLHRTASRCDAPGMTSSGRFSQSPRLRGDAEFKGALLVSTFLAAALALSACGTKGDLECPRGTLPQADGTCRPPVK